jgi:D-glycero-alpha-D-manno-heptose-7-phosphate kinase
MIIARAPLRISFGGGGTDLAAYYHSFGGLVVSASIDAYVYVMLTPAARGLHIITADGGKLSQRSALTLQGTEQDMRLPLTVLQQCAPDANLRVFITGEVPSGTGLGSSSATTVALITALTAHTGVHFSAEQIAALASEIEIDHLGSPIGKQDQYASALGGLNTFVFQADDHVRIEPLELDPMVAADLEQRLMLFFTGSRRDAGSILVHQRRQSEERDTRTLAALHAIKALAGEIRAALLVGDLDRFGQLLHRSWQQKRRVAAGISTSFIDHCYAMARTAGALGGKITGAGGGGFLLLYCREEQQPSVIEALHGLGLELFPFRLSAQGAEVLINDSTEGIATWSPGRYTSVMAGQA